ncbi:hypothetical protein Xen7305DRAFT_00028870 [Xenococcus sp. PCC 7305]|nr:hypothetical protein Xen7305DRAFT_00028870 [Xenococcus sp. PCC 7305]
MIKKYNKNMKYKEQVRESQEYQMITYAVYKQSPLTYVFQYY